MKAYVLEGKGILRIEDRDMSSAKADEALVKITNIGICGSDIHLYRGSYSGPHGYPMLFGHEWSGVVQAVGSDVVDLQPGDKVTGDCSRYCGNCDMCDVDRNLCKHIQKFGITIDGASAEYIARETKYLYKAPNEVDLDLLCLTEPMAVAAHLIRRVEAVVSEFDRKKILVYGGGAIGMSALLILRKYYGCADVSLFDMVKEKRELARALGANIPTEGILNVQADESRYDSLYSAAEYDIVFETTGNLSVFQNTLYLAKPLGIIGCVGMIPEVAINQKLIVVKSLTVLGSIGGTGEFPMVIDFMKENSETVRKLITHRFAISEAEKAFELSRSVSKALKVQLILE